MAPIPRTNADTAAGARLGPGSMSIRVGLIRVGLPLLLGLSVAGCSVFNSANNLLFGKPSGPQPGQPGYVKGFIGEVVADEPRAALAGRDVLSGGATGPIFHDLAERLKKRESSSC